MCPPTVAGRGYGEGVWTLIASQAVLVSVLVLFIRAEGRSLRKDVAIFRAEVEARITGVEARITARVDVLSQKVDGLALRIDRLEGGTLTRA